MQVVHYQRKSNIGNFSIENIFEGVRKSLSSKANIRLEISPLLSTGIKNRLFNLYHANKVQGDVNHITGDIHYIILALSRKKTILTIHDLAFLDHEKNKLKKWLLHIFWLWLPVKYAKKVTVISEATRNDVFRYMSADPEKIVVIPDFIDARYHRHDKAFEQDKPLIMHIGTKNNKNLYRLIEALEGLNCRLLIVGILNDAYVQALNKHRIDYENVYNLSLEQVIECYKRADILAFVSTLEGFGMPIIEAQTVGRAVLTSNVSSMPEVAGEGACLVDPFDVADIRRGLEKIIYDHAYREDLIAKGFENIKRFEIDRIAQMYLDLYKEVYDSLKS